MTDGSTVMIIEITLGFSLLTLMSLFALGWCSNASLCRIGACVPFLREASPAGHARPGSPPHSSCRHCSQRRLNLLS